jgi:arsenate reductase
LHSKSWDSLGDTPFDIVITVCDQAAGEACPVFFGAPVKAHWGVPDPAHATGTEAEVMQAFQSAYDTLAARIRALLALPYDMPGAALAAALRDIGEKIA